MTAELRARVLDLLREMQWSSIDGYRCHSCGGGYNVYTNERKHTSDCELAALLRELERETEAERQAGMETRGWDSTGSGEDEQ